MQFRTILRSSIIGPEFYRSLPRRPFSFSLKYFISLGVMLGVVFSFFFSWAAIPALNLFMADTGKELIENFPENLIISFKNGAASVNVPEPYYLPLPEKLRSSDASSNKVPANLLAIDTRTDVPSNRFGEYDAYIVLTKNHLMSGTSEHVTVEQIQNMADLTISRAGLSYFAGQLNELARWLAPAVVLGAFLFFLFIFALNLFYALFGALVVLLLAYFRKLPMAYGGAYRVALHAMTPGVLVNFLILPVSLGSDTGVIFSALFVITLWFNLVRVAQAPSAVV